MGDSVLQGHDSPNNDTHTHTHRSGEGDGERDEDREEGWMVGTKEVEDCAATPCVLALKCLLQALWLLHTPNVNYLPVCVCVYAYFLLT